MVVLGRPRARRPRRRHPASHQPRAGPRGGRACRHARARYGDRARVGDSVATSTANVVLIGRAFDRQLHIACPLCKTAVAPRTTCDVAASRCRDPRVVEVSASGGRVRCEVDPRSESSKTCGLRGSVAGADPSGAPCAARGDRREKGPRPPLGAALAGRDSPQLSLASSDPSDMAAISQRSMPTLLASSWTVNHERGLRRPLAYRHGVAATAVARMRVAPYPV